MSNIKLILACIALTFGLNASANAFTLFDKKFKNYDECKQYASSATNDTTLTTIMVGWGCNKLYTFTPPPRTIYLPDGATLPYEYGVGGISVDQAIDYLYKNYPKHFIKNPSMCKNCVYLPDGYQVTNVPKSMGAKDVWLAMYSKNMLNFESLFSLPVIKNEKDGKFGQCIINNIEGMITDDAKFKRIISCGDSSKLQRSYALTMAEGYSPEGKRQKEIDAINLRNDQRSAEMNRMNRINTLFLMGTQ